MHVINKHSKLCLGSFHDVYKGLQTLYFCLINFLIVDSSIEAVFCDSKRLILHNNNTFLGISSVKWLLFVQIFPNKVEVSVNFHKIVLRLPSLSGIFVEVCGFLHLKFNRCLHCLLAANRTRFTFLLSRAYLSVKSISTYGIELLFMIYFHHG